LAKRVKLERSGSTFSVSATSQTREVSYGVLAGSSEPTGDAGQAVRPPRARRRSTAKKGWKGWVEVEESEAEPESLIRLDATPPIKDRRTRSGKNFDAIGVGDMNWV